MNGGSLSLGRYAGIPVRAHWSIALIALLFGTILAGRLGLAGAIVATLAFFASIVAHEFGHALVARRFGVSTESIDLWPLGGVARLDREPPTPRAEGWIAVAGPLVSLLIGVGRRSASPALRRPNRPCSAGSGSSTLLLGVFNLLPGAPLDGGRIVRAVRWATHGNSTGRRARPARPDGCIGWALGRRRASP